MTDSDSNSPPYKKRRHNCNCEGLKKQIHKLTDDLKQRDKLIQDQLHFLAEAIVKQRVMLNALYSKQSDIDSLRNKFPVVNALVLRELNESIVPDNRKEYIEAIKGLLLPSGIKKNLRSILSEDVTYEYNVDGVQGKKSLKALSNFYSVLLDAISCTGDGNPEYDLRKAMQLQKKRHFKSIAAKKNLSN